METIEVEIDYSKIQNYFIKDSDSHQFLHYPKSYGYWRLGGQHGLSIASPTKPKWIHIKMMKLLLGIDWIEAEEHRKSS